MKVIAELGAGLAIVGSVLIALSAIQVREVETEIASMNPPPAVACELSAAE